MRRHAPVFAAVGACWAVFLCLAAGFIHVSAPTYDEPVHLASGYYALTGSKPLNWKDHPPLAEAWDALPLLALRPGALRQAAATLPLYGFADLFLYKNNVGPERLLNTARLWSAATWGALTLAVIAAWAFALGGAPAALGAAALFAFFPPFLSNASLIGTDMGAAALYAAAFFLLSQKNRTVSVCLAAGASLGAAMGAKFSLVVAPVVAAVALLTERRLEAAPKLSLKQGMILAAATAGALLLLYAPWGPGLYREGLLETAARLSQGRSSFFAGRHGTTGWALYFPVALLLKTPPPTLLLGGAALSAWLRRPKRDHFWVAFPAVAFFAGTLLSKTQIGYRHALPVLPFLLVMAGWSVSELWRRPWGRVAALALLGWQVVDVARVQPYQLAYFSPLAGGPEAGHRWLVDSNLDWGQDLPTLAREVRRRGLGPIYLSYFGVGDPSYYGIQYLPLAWYSHAARQEGVARPTRAWLAVSATNLEGQYYADPSLWSWLRTRRPTFSAGHSIFLYDLEQDAEGRAKLAAVVAAAGASQ